MTIEIPTWLLWSVLNLIILLLIVAVVVILWRRKDRRQAADMQLVIDHCYDLQARLASHATLWLVGRHVRGNHWDVQGIFSDRALAIAACKNVRYFLFALDLDQELPEASATPFKLEYPKEAD